MLAQFALIDATGEVLGPDLQRREQDLSRSLSHLVEYISQRGVIAVIGPQVIERRLHARQAVAGKDSCPLEGRLIRLLRFHEMRHEVAVLSLAIDGDLEAL